MKLKGFIKKVNGFVFKVFVNEMKRVVVAKVLGFPLKIRSRDIVNKIGKARCQDGDVFDVKVGVAIAIKNVLGSLRNKVLNDLANRCRVIENTLDKAIGSCNEKIDSAICGD